MLFVEISYGVLLLLVIKLPSWVYVKWDTICTPKENGGLDFRHLSTWNKAAIGKMVWHIGN